MISMSSRAWVALILLLWVFAGPIGTAFDTCPTMSMLCDGPCGVLVATMTTAPVRVAGPDLVATLAFALAECPRTTAPAVLEPPPKSASHSA